jgi:signal transduction histidine kinase
MTDAEQVNEKIRAMNEALVIGSVRQHELIEAADALNVRLQAEISERKQVEEELRQAKAQLMDRAGQLEEIVAQRTSDLGASNQQLEAFVYSIAHDLRAPLRIMQGFSTMLVEEAGATLNETAKDFARRINKSAKFMDALLIDLLTFSRVSQQQVELRSVNLKMVVESVLSRLQPDILEKECEGRTAGLLAGRPGARTHACAGIVQFGEQCLEICCAGRSAAGATAHGGENGFHSRLGGRQRSRYSI